MGGVTTFVKSCFSHEKYIQWLFIATLQNLKMVSLAVKVLVAVFFFIIIIIIIIFTPQPLYRWLHGYGKHAGELADKAKDSLRKEQ